MAVVCMYTFCHAYYSLLLFFFFVKHKTAYEILISDWSSDVFSSDLDVASNGEQAREGFFLYVQHRMSGFGGRWKRPPWKDLSSYPEFMEQRREWKIGRAHV